MVPTKPRASPTDREDKIGVSFGEIKFNWVWVPRWLKSPSQQFSQSDGDAWIELIDNLPPKDSFFLGQEVGLNNLFDILE
jgi:hypothetical protein